MNMRSLLSGYTSALNAHLPYDTTGLCGRIIRGTSPSDFLTLSDDPRRKIIMLVGADGLAKLLQCKDGKAMLEAIGYEPAYIVRKVGEGNQFKLVVCHESASPARLATWDGVMASIEMVYPPDITEKVRKQLPALKLLRTPATRGWTFADFEALEKEAGYDFSVVDADGSFNWHFMTDQRYRESEGTLIETRAFLYFVLHLRELFGGDGYTYDVNGVRGMMEYFCPNIELAKLGDHELIDISVSLA